MNGPDVPFFEDKRRRHAAAFTYGCIAKRSWTDKASGPAFGETGWVQERLHQENNLTKE